MSGPRKHVITGLLILMCSLSEHCSESAPSTGTGKAVSGVAQRNLRRTVEIVRHVEGSRGHHSVKTEAPFTSRAGSSSVELRDFRTRTERNQGVVLFPKDLKTKEKIIKYFTGPLVFSPKCRKNAYRLYHLTRDCTIPAYFKRCARLLTRLAGSPQCTEG